jgi:CHAT domain-containing protein
LGAALLNPVQEMLQGASAVVVVPSAALYGLPFHAMHYQGGPLAATHRVSYATFARNVLEAYERTHISLSTEASWKGLGVVEVNYMPVPRLPFVNLELSNISAKFSSPSRIVDPPASSRDLLESAATCNVLHVACHGDFNMQAPLLSRLIMADRPVFAFEIMLRRGVPQLVSLSACETAEGRADLGGYVESLASAFLRAGSNSVIAALWPLEDEAAASVMEQFYDGLLSPAGRSTAASLQLAQQNLMTKQHHPYFWASFAAYGT